MIALLSPTALETGLLQKVSLGAMRTRLRHRQNQAGRSGYSAASRCRHRAFRRRCGACRIIRMGPATATCSIVSPVLPSRIRRSRHRCKPAASRCDPWAGGSLTNRQLPWFTHPRRQRRWLRLTIQISRAASWEARRSGGNRPAKSEPASAAAAG
jgi:hypothetical protein